MPQHDFADPKTFVTPSSHRFMTKEVQEINGTKKLVTVHDQSVVYTRPKFFVGSSATTWFNEQMEIRCKLPSLYEVESENTDKESSFFNRRVQDKLTHFIDSTSSEDILSITNKDSCVFHGYEKQWVNNLVTVLKESENHVHSMKGLQQEVCDYLNQMLGGVTGKELLKAANKLTLSLEKTLENMPQSILKPNVYELTDAGPGVSVHNRDVKFRAAERVRIHNLDRYGRSHMAQEDQGRNEAERTTAVIGNALVNGGPIQWQFHKMFDGNKDRLLSSTLDEYEAEKERVMQENAWSTCEYVKGRIHDAPGPGENDYLKGFVTPRPNAAFLWDKVYLDKYVKIYVIILFHIICSIFRK